MLGVNKKNINFRLIYFNEIIILHKTLVRLLGHNNKHVIKIISLKK